MGLEAQHQGLYFPGVNLADYGFLLDIFALFISIGAVIFTISQSQSAERANVIAKKISGLMAIATERAGNFKRDVGDPLGRELDAIGVLVFRVISDIERGQLDAQAARDAWNDQKLQFRKAKSACGPHVSEQYFTAENFKQCFLSDPYDQLARSLHGSIDDGTDGPHLEALRLSYAVFAQNIRSVIDRVLADIYRRPAEEIDEEKSGQS